MSVFNNKVSFAIPKSSKFNLSHSVKFSSRIGKLMPVATFHGTPSDAFKIKVNLVQRFAPMLAPVMERFRTDVDALFVPYRLLLKNNETNIPFFNPSEDDSTRSNPFCERAYYGAHKFALHPCPIVGSLWDMLGYPMDSHFCGKVFSCQYSKSATPSTYVDFDPMDLSITYRYRQLSAGDRLKIIDPDTPNYYSVASVPSAAANFHKPYICAYWWLYDRWIAAGGTGLPVPGNDESFASYLGRNFKDEDEFLRMMLSDFNVTADFRNYTLHSWLSCAYLYNLCWSGTANTFNINGSNWQPLNYSAIRAYWRCYYDKYINTSIDGLPDSLLDIKCYDNTLYSNNLGSPLKGNEADARNAIWIPADRWLPNDSFTSATPTATGANNAVNIPTGTIMDLRNATQLQKFRERTNYAGRRFYDQIVAHFGVKPEHIACQMADVVGRTTFDSSVTDIMSQSNDANTPVPTQKGLGGYAGAGWSNGSGYVGKKFMSEYGVILLMMSTMPKSVTYQDGIDPENLKDSYYDYLNGQFAGIGDAEIPSSLVSYQCGHDVTSRFGYNRRYWEYMTKNDRICGDFRNSLDYFVLGRRFGNMNPTLRDVSRLTKLDNVDKIFNANDGWTDHLYNYLMIDCSAVRQLPRDIKLDL